MLPIHRSVADEESASRVTARRAPPAQLSLLGTASPTPDADPPLPLLLGLARSADERREAQRLRYLVFAEELGIPLGDARRGLDEDEFDSVCDHLLVRDPRTGQVIGTYRMLPPHRRRRIGRLYADEEFDLAPLNDLLPSMVEVGRSCVHPDHRRGATMLMLWTGLIRYMQAGRYQHLLGCASASLGEDGAQAATLRDHLLDHLVAPEFRVTPRLPYRHESVARASRLVIPPLIKGYLRVGAKVCGEPAWDQAFQCADFLVWLRMGDLSPRYARHFDVAPHRDAASDRWRQGHCTQAA
jgi:putative hemolysin